MFSLAKSSIFLMFLGFSRQSAQEASSKTCMANGCPSHHRNCEASPSHCAAPVSFYSRDGSAQAYKPHAPVKSDVCMNTSTKQRMATWFLARSSRRSAPQVKVGLQLQECTSNEESECCCTPRGKGDVKIEIWQTKPDGRYSSITPGREEGVCRATLEHSSFTTLAPGSTGIMGGLGPSGWDFLPYGPPVIHMLFSGEHYEPLLVHLPIIFDRNLQPRSFGGPDWRGPAHMTSKQPGEKFSIESWNVYENDTIEIEVNIFLKPTKSSYKSLKSMMCQSNIYGLPSSFFLEPISVCATSMLDFFPL